MFSHTEKVRYKGNPCSKFVLKGGLDDTFLKGGLKGGPDIILGFKKGKMLNMDKMLPVLNYSEKMKYKNPYPNFLLKGVLYIFERESQRGVCGVSEMLPVSVVYKS